MKLLNLFSTAALGLLALLPVGLNAQTVTPGTVKVIKVTGEAKLDSGAIKNGDIFAQGKTIVTGANARVLVRFSNGAAMSIRENSSIKVATFQQEPITTVKVATHEQIKSEPSKSNTQVSLNYGKVIARAHQMSAKGSKFEINTPSGAAGIRGSIVIVSYDSVTGTMTAASLQGSIEAKGSTETQWISVKEGSQIQITVVKDANGIVTSFGMVVDKPISDEELLPLLKEIGLNVFNVTDASIVSPSDDSNNLPPSNP